MTVLILKQTEIHSLAQLRENFDLAQVTEAFLDRSLEQWLANRYYEGLAERVEELDHTPSEGLGQKLCRILGVDYAAVDGLSDEQRAAYDRKRAAIRAHTDDPEALSHVMDTATDQTELAELLNEGRERIYLCGGPFHVPIRKAGIHYIGIGDPRMEAPYTEEQYRRAGIAFDGVRLPASVSEEARPRAEAAARANGYDDYGDTHGPLATVFHFRLKGARQLWYLHLDWDRGVIYEFYRTKLAAENAMKRELNRAYDQANGCFTPGHAGCLADRLAKQYARALQKGCGGLLERLAPWCEEREGHRERLAALSRLAEDAEKTLRQLFLEELEESADYYRMYDRRYFLEQVTIEKNDYNVDLFDSDLVNGLFRILCDDSEYDIRDLHEVIMELENDANEHANTFFSAAYDIYGQYRAKMEEIAGEIGADITAEELTKLGLLEAHRTA